jgi:hypothetical protein
MIDGSFVPERRRSVGMVEIDGRAILMEAETGSLQLLDPVGTAVWSALDGGRTVEGVAAELAARYGAPVTLVGGDVSRFVAHLGREGMLEGVAGEDEGEVDPSSRRGRRADPEPSEPRFIAEPPSS